MFNKKILLKIVLPITLCFILICAFIIYHKPEPEFEGKSYTQNEVADIFEQNKELFLKLPKILETEAFWEKGRPHETVSHAYLTSPYDEKKLSLFSEEDKETLIELFETTKPRMIILDYQEHLRITFWNEDNTSTYVIFYVYRNWRGDRYPLKTPEYNILSYVTEEQFNYINLGDGWGLYDARGYEKTPESFIDSSVISSVTSDSN